VTGLVSPELDAETRARVVAAVDDVEVLDLTRRLVETPSQCGIDPEEPCARIVADVLTASGIEAELREVAPGRPNVVARLEGGDAPAVAFNGHLDTTPMALDWTFGHEVRIEDGYLRGHGARNMKGGVAAMVLAAVALKRSGVRLPGDLWVTAVMGHHDGGVGSAALAREGLVAPYTIFPEPTDLGIRTTQAGSLTVRLSVTGTTGPAGDLELFREFGDESDWPVDTARELRPLLDALDAIRWTYEPDERMPHLPLTQIRQIRVGYGREHVPMAFAPDAATISLGVWTVNGQTVESVLEDVRRAVAPVAAERGLALELEVIPSGSGLRMREPLDTPLDASVVGALQRAHRAVTGGEPSVGALLPHSYFGCDSQVLAPAGTIAVSYGPASHAYRRDNRGKVRIASLGVCARVLALAALELGAAAREV
jgi:acetylornithine deacetylase